MGNTTRLSASLGSGYSFALGVWGRDPSGVAQPAKGVWVYNAGWVARYSVLTASVNSGAGASAAGSGASSSGTATTAAVSTGVAGSIGAAVHSWASFSGDGSITCSNPSSATPTFSRLISGVASGTTSAPITGTWRNTVSDSSTGATTTADCPLSFTWQNTIPPFGPFVFSSGGFSGSGASGAGPGHSISVPWSGSATVDFASGGPVSGSYSYAWTRTGGDSGVSCSNSAIKTPTFSGTFIVPAATNDTQSAIWQCLVTDTVSGFSYTVTNIVTQYSYTNNTG